MFLGSLFHSRCAAAWKALSPATVFVFGMWSREGSNEERVAYVTVDDKTSSLKYSGARAWRHLYTKAIILNWMRIRIGNQWSSCNRGALGWSRPTRCIRRAAMTGLMSKKIEKPGFSIEKLGFSIENPVSRQKKKTKQNSFSIEIPGSRQSKNQVYQPSF